MHQPTRGSLPLSAVPGAFYYERETVPTSNSDLWNEFASGDVSRIVDFSYAGYDQGRSDPPFVSATDGWNVIPVTCGADVCILVLASLFMFLLIRCAHILCLHLLGSSIYMTCAHILGLLPY